MIEHGTKAFLLKPASIVTAALADLELRKHQRRPVEGWATSEPYCFHRAHVFHAKSVRDLLERAIKDRYSGVYSSKRVTCIVYGDEDLLWEAYALAGEEAAAS